MDSADHVVQRNRAFWDDQAKEGGGFSTPWLDLDVEAVRRYVADPEGSAPACLRNIYPVSILKAVEGAEVLCLASGGGQQSVVFGLLGADVTVVDVSGGQLEKDAEAAEHYGYAIDIVRTDMRDLSCLEGKTFDLVYQAPSMSYVPSVREVYAQVVGLLKTGGIYRLEITNPAVQFVDETWREGGYRITKPYALTVAPRGDGAIDHRHYLRDIFNGLIELGFRIEHVEEAPFHLAEAPDAEPGSWPHVLAHIPWIFAIVARKEASQPHSPGLPAREARKMR